MRPRSIARVDQTPFDGHSNSMRNELRKLGSDWSWGFVILISLTLVAFDNGARGAETETVQPTSELIQQEANQARTHFWQWFHKDAMDMTQPEIRDLLAKKLLGLNPIKFTPGGTPEYREYSKRANEELKKKVLTMDSIPDRDTQACLMDWAKYIPGGSPEILVLFKKKGIDVRPGAAFKKVEDYILKNYPETSCALSIALHNGYFLQTGPGCDDNSPEIFQQQMTTAEFPLHLQGQKLTAKEKTLVYANVAYIGEWAWEALHEKNANIAENYRKTAIDALNQMNANMPETKKWNDARLKALNAKVGSVMQDCVVPGD